ncbi:ComEC/Rec2 family competence protein [Actibacterium sp. 188UL27-1]|nr:ComEC/Rec2 family competence protein [Actibacterium sp. 188UL27-1]MBM7067653.1 ComEC/Rec2 family competence protein [Actibacterium sp. 188UL27-1]
MLTGLETALLAQRGYLLLWAPICLGAGVGLYFALPVEPDWSLYGWAIVVAALIIGAGWWAGEAVRPLFMAMVLIIVGALLAGARAHSVAAPVLGFRYYGPIEGRVVAIDRSASDKIRLTLDHVMLERMAPDRTPARVRVSLHGQQGFVDPAPGMVVILTGHLSAPGGPVEPGGFDFARKAWFDRLGAVGYTRSPVLALEPAKANSLALRVFQIRRYLSQAVQDRMPGKAGGFAAALTTGDRSGIPQEDLEDLRKSNLAHLLAISGLHMGLLTGVIFGGLRVALSLIPALALRVPVKKIAAATALVAGFAYLLLSGGTVSTQRAFIMVSVMLCAVLLDQRAISLRSVAIAAIIVLVLRPESLFSPGFQMSFAATIALIAVFGGLRDLPVQPWRLPKLAQGAVALLMSSAVAGAATAPFGAAHFNQIADYGLIANFLSVPVMGALVMPAAVIAALLAPFGLEQLALEPMRWGLLWILGVSSWVAGLDGSVTRIMAPGPWVLPVMSIGALVVILWQGRARYGGIGLIAAGLMIWTQTERPPVLISETAGLIGVMTADGRALNKVKGDGFAAGIWLENDGDTVDQSAAAARLVFQGQKGDLVLDLAGTEIRHLSGRAVASRASAPCGPGILISTRAPDQAPSGPCQVITPDTLRDTGSLALWPDDQGKIRIVSARDQAGDRLWSRAQR